MVEPSPFVPLHPQEVIVDVYGPMNDTAPPGPDRTVHVMDEEQIEQLVGALNSASAGDGSILSEDDGTHYVLTLVYRSQPRIVLTVRPRQARISRAGRGIRLLDRPLTTYLDQVLADTPA